MSYRQVNNLANSKSAEQNIVFGQAQLLLPDGSESAPALSFINDTNSGLKLETNGEIRMVINGNDEVIFNSSQIRVGGTIQGDGGTEASPGYRFQGDEDTGIANPSSDVLLLSAGGEARMNMQPDLLQLTPGGSINPSITCATSPTNMITFNHEYRSISQPAFIQRKVTGQAIPDDSETRITFDEYPILSQGGISNINDLFTIPSPGVYLVTCGIFWDNDSTGRRLVLLRRNQIRFQQWTQNEPASGDTERGVISAVIYADNAELIDVVAYHTAGHDLTFGSSNSNDAITLSIIKLF